MNDVPLFDDLTPPAGQAERIPIAVPTERELLYELALMSREAAMVCVAAGSGPAAEFASRVVLLCEQTRAYLGAREP